MRIPYKNNKGSVLVWAVVISLVLTILVGTTLSIAFSFYHRSVNNNSMKQAYFTSRSVVEAISKEIKGETANGIAIVALLVNTGDVVNLNNVNFINDTRYMGTTIANVTLIAQNVIKITATTTVANQTKTVSLRIQKGTGTTLPIGTEFPGLEVDDTTIISETYTYITTAITQDIYAQANSTVVFDNNAEYYGIIYAESGVHITINQGSKFLGTIYAQSGTIFSFTKLHNFFTGLIYVKNGAIIKVNNVNYTITQNGSNISVSPNGMNTTFKSLLRIYTGSAADGGWGDSVYE